MDWKQALQTGVSRHSAQMGTECIDGVEVSRFRPRVPLLFLSGATPGPFYHSHPHIHSEFDHLNMDMAAQVESNLQTVGKIGRAVHDYSAELPFELLVETDWLKRPQVLHWISNNGDGFAANQEVTSQITPKALKEFGLDEAEILGNFEVGDNVTDRRFLLETFAMFGFEGHDLGSEKAIVQIDIKNELDPKYFMPYVAGYIASGPADLALFTLSAASGEQTAPKDSTAQIEALLDKLVRLLEKLGATFDDVILAWNRVANLDADEEAVLMTRSRKGLKRPLAEAVLGLAAGDTIPPAADGTPIALEYIVLVQVPQIHS